MTQAPPTCASGVVAVGLVQGQREPRGWTVAGKGAPPLHARNAAPEEAPRAPRERLFLPVLSVGLLGTPSGPGPAPKVPPRSPERTARAGLS